MQADPIQEWQRLTEHYRQMGDEELRELAYDFSNLTETAQQVLRSEMRSRRLGDPEAVNEVPQDAIPGPRTVTTAPGAPELVLNRAATTHRFFGSEPELVPDTAENGDEGDGPHDYTWKTLLCECETAQQARELSAALKQAGIESWIEGPSSSTYSAYARSDLVYPRVLVAADQLERARTVAAQPIPQDIVQACAMQIPEFTPPKCPHCGAEDPVLEAVDPANTWRCEQCDEEWTEMAASGEGGAPGPGESPL